jgi:hypothetical protein
VVKSDSEMKEHGFETVEENGFEGTVKECAKN